MLALLSHLDFCHFVISCVSVFDLWPLSLLHSFRLLMMLLVFALRVSSEYFVSLIVVVLALGLIAPTVVYFLLEY